MLKICMVGFANAKAQVRSNVHLKYVTKCKAKIEVENIAIV